jgi:hypothetical protein
VIFTSMRMLKSHSYMYSSSRISVLEPFISHSLPCTCFLYTENSRKGASENAYARIPDYLHVVLKLGLHIWPSTWWVIDYRVFYDVLIYWPHKVVQLHEHEGC